MLILRTFKDSLLYNALVCGRNYSKSLTSVETEIKFASLLFCRDLNKMADGMGSKFGRLIYSFVAFIAGYCLGFIYLWQMTFVMLAFLPVVAISAGLIAKVYCWPNIFQKIAKDEQPMFMLTV